MSLDLIANWGTDRPKRPVADSTCYLDDKAWIVLTSTCGEPGQLAVPPGSALWQQLVSFADEVEQ